MRQLALAFLLAGGPALSEEFVETKGRLSDDDFYRLVSCGAAPGGDCRELVVRWRPTAISDLRVVLNPVPPDYPKALAKAMLAALDQAIAEINASGSSLRLRRVPTGHGAPLVVYLTAARTGEPIRGTGIEGIDGEVIGGGLTTVWWNDSNEITNAYIVMSGDLPLPQVRSVMLEELTQAMGLMTDIRNPDYDDFSIFSEDSNSVTRLGPQDLMALRRHYP